MSRIRWYHFYFLLALFDVGVIMFSLHLHDRTLDGVGRLLKTAVQLDAKSRWHRTAQQRILELNAPGNELFRSKDHQHEQARFRVARLNMADTLDSPMARDMDTALLRERIDKMVAAARIIFDEFDAMREPHLSADQRQESMAHAGQAMAKMDEQQHLALRALAVLIEQNAADRYGLLQGHEAALQDRLNSERYFLAAVVLILVGVLGFGRRLQQADRALREERRLVKEERRERLAAIGELCSSVAHGIRNPLASIRSSADLTLELGTMDDNSRLRLNDILDEGRRLGDRVSGLLSMARVTNDSFRMVNLSEVVLSAANELCAEFAKRGLNLTPDVADPEIMVLGDHRQLEQVVIELLSNAMEHSDADSEVRVTCEALPAEGRAIIRVENDGSGIPSEVKSRIFDLFFTTKPSGTGIGLATVKRSARLHGGDVTLLSTAEGRTRFEVWLPLTKPDRKNRQALSMEPSSV